MSQIPWESQHCLSRGEAKGARGQGSPGGAEGQAAPCLQWDGVPPPGWARRPGYPASPRTHSWKEKCFHGGVLGAADPILCHCSRARANIFQGTPAARRGGGGGGRLQCISHPPPAASTPAKPNPARGAAAPAACAAAPAGTRGQHHRAPRLSDQEEKPSGVEGCKS